MSDRLPAAVAASDAPSSVARIRVELTEPETRSLVHAAALVTDVLRPELFDRTGARAASPLVTACQALVGACERAGVDLHTLTA